MSDDLSGGTVSIPVKPNTTGFGKGLTAGLESETSGLAGFGSKLGKQLATNFIAGFGLLKAGEALTGFVKDSVQAASDYEQSQLKLNDAFSKFPKLADTNVDSLNELNESLENKTKFDKNALASGEGVLAQFGLTGKQLLTLTPLLEDYAARTGKDLPSAATTLGKALLGQGRALKDVGVNFKDTKDLGGNYNELVGDLRQQVGGFATKEGLSMQGRLDIINNKVEAAKVKIGGALMPVLSTLVGYVSKTVVPTLTDFSDWFTKTGEPAIEGIVGWIGKYKDILIPAAAGLGVLTAASWAWDAALDANPIGAIVLAVEALAGLGILVAANWTPLENFAQNSIITLGHFATSVASGVLGVFASVVNGISGAINTVTGILNPILALFHIPILPKIGNIDFTDAVAAQQSYLTTIGSMAQIQPAQKGTGIPAGGVANGKKMADGGTVMPTPGGTPVIVAEAGYPETILNTKDLNDFAASLHKSSGFVNKQYIYTSDPMVAANQSANQIKSRLALAR